MKIIQLTIALFLLLTSCAHVISPENLQGSMQKVGFTEILNNTSNFINTTFVLGGTIVGMKDSRQGSEIEVIQNPIDRYGSIVDKDISDGRFIVIGKHLDPLIYKKGRLVTIAGKLTGSRAIVTDEMEYKYPIFEAKEIYLWKREKIYSYPFFYDPYYSYPYSYYWFDPFWGQPYSYP